MASRSLPDIRPERGDFRQSEGSHKTLIHPSATPGANDSWTGVQERGGGGDAAQDRSSMRSENGCHASASRCLMSSNSIPTTPHLETLDSRRRFRVGRTALSDQNLTQMLGSCGLPVLVRGDSPLTLSVGEVAEQSQDEQRQQRRQQRRQRGPRGPAHGGTAWHQHALAASVELAHRAL